jgi:hypothetical protein
MTLPTPTQTIWLLADAYREPAVIDQGLSWPRPATTWLQRRLAELKQQEKERANNG